MRSPFLILLAATLLALCAPRAQAGTVTYTGTAADGDYALTLDTTDPRSWFGIPYGYLDVVLTVGDDSYDFRELIYGFGPSLYVSPYGFTLAGNAVTLEFPRARGNDLAALTLTYAEAYQGPLTVAGLLAYLVETPLEGITGFRRNGREIFDFEVPPTPVPLPAGAWLYLTGLGVALRRRLVELGGIEPPTS